MTSSGKSEDPRAKAALVGFGEMPDGYRWDSPPKIKSHRTPRCSFEEYWNPIEAGMGSMPQVYVALPETERRAVRDEVKSRLSSFESNGHPTMSVEMLIGVGRA
jgi:hypothetical protein